MTSTQKTNFPPLEWAPCLQTLLQDSRALATGVFDLSGNLIWSNAGMDLMLSPLTFGASPADAFLNPSFNDLALAAPSDDPVFKGVLTMGDGKNTIRSLGATVWRGQSEILAAGEFDVMELDRLNRQLIDYNREINNLQRKLIKEKRRLEDTLTELRETQAMLIQSEKMNAMGQLVAGVAHEINNPLGYVTSNIHSLKTAFLDIAQAYDDLETLINSLNDPALAEKKSGIRDNHDIDFLFEDMEDLHQATIGGLKRIKKIITDLRNFSRLDEAEQKLVNLLENVNSTLSLASPELKNRQVETMVDIDRSIELECFPALLNQVFLNLMVNAAQAMENGGTLTIQATESRDQVHLKFSDTGPGIPAEHLGSIFNPFFTTKPVGEGTGLGLSIAYKIIADRHGGDIRAESQPGKGAIFYIDLPKGAAFPSYSVGTIR